MSRIVGNSRWQQKDEYERDARQTQRDVERKDRYEGDRHRSIQHEQEQRKGKIKIELGRRSMEPDRTQETGHRRDGEPDRTQEHGHRRDIELERTQELGHREGQGTGQDARTGSQKGHETREDACEGRETARGIVSY